jgi:hypothetical protein
VIARELAKVNLATTPLHDPLTDTNGYVAVGDAAIFVVFRGTEPFNFRDWWLDAQFRTVHVNSVTIHEGFLNGATSVLNTIQACLQAHPGKPIWITGHSLGGALAHVGAYLLGGKNVKGLYTFGPPRVGQWDLCSALETTYPNAIYRLVYGSDIVPGLPPEFIHGYRHAGNLIWIDFQGGIHRYAARTELPPELPKDALLEFIASISNPLRGLFSPPQGIDDHVPLWYQRFIEAQARREP